MRPLIQDYLSSLRELDELDSVVADLCSAMGHKILVKPQKGVRQGGVDLHTTGIDPDDGMRKNFLVTIKRGNIDRASWDSGQQSVRQSINDILDNYIPQKIGVEEAKLPKKIIVCCGGEVKQEVADSLNGFPKNNPKIAGDISLDTWNGSKLSLLIESHLLSEHIFFDEMRRGMRRSLVVLEDVDYDLSHFKKMVSNLFNHSRWASYEKKKLEKEACMALLTLPVCLSLVNHYSREANNLKHPLFAAEYSMLLAWDFILRHGLQSNKKILRDFNRIFYVYLDYGINYVKKVSPHCLVEEGITKGCSDSATASIVSFEQIGIFATVGIANLLYSQATNNQVCRENARNIADLLREILKNNGSASSPCFDEMSVDICLGLILLLGTNQIDSAREWIDDLILRFIFSFNSLERHFPISQDSLEELVEFRYGDKLKKEDMVKSSTLLAILAYWCANFDFKVQYDHLVKFVEQSLADTTLQLWFPGKGIKESFYKSYSGHEFGITEAPIYLPKTTEELRARIEIFLKEASSEEFEREWFDCPPGLQLIASRQFRTPVVPFIWLLIKPHRDDEAQGVKA